MRATQAIRGDDGPAPVAAADDIGLFEMANLPTSRTGVPGVIYISTAQGRHAPRVKWYPGRPSANAPCLSVTIEAAPNAFNHHLPRADFEAAVGPVTAWVTLNREALLAFWTAGTSWMDDEVTDFKAALRPITPAAL